MQVDPHWSDGTPIGGQPHWFTNPNRVTVGDHVRDVARGAAEVGAVSYGLTYWASRDGHKAVQAAKWGVLLYLALIPLFGLSIFCLAFLPLALLAGDLGFAFWLALIPTVTIWLAVHLIRRTWRRGQQERWFVNDNHPHYGHVIDTTAH